ncbi:TIGR03032 family protein [Spirulina subsalsa]|nr:TIGR03032 family protein [Spirulina subsalsa]
MTQANTVPPLSFSCSRQFIPWLAQQQISLAFTTYQTNRLFLLGMKPDGSLSIFERLFQRPMGLFSQPNRLWMSTRFQLWQLDNVLTGGQFHKGYDQLYIPRIAYTTGDIDVHDLVVDERDRPIFVNTLFSCVATVSDRHSFTPLWQPPFITQLVPEDRCHLNGLALVDGKPRYVTAVSRSDVAAGWRQRRQDGGCVVDMQTNEVILTNLSMPHSPRWYRGKLWLLNSGTGDFGYFDPVLGQFEPVTFCPGYLRGLTFYQDWAIVGLSKPRGEQTFSGLELEDRLTAKDAIAQCGLLWINLNTGIIDHWLQIDGVISELYDVQIIPNALRPMVLGFMTDEICQLITLEQQPIPTISPDQLHPLDSPLSNPSQPNSEPNLTFLEDELERGANQASIGDNPLYWQGN